MFSVILFGTLGYMIVERWNILDSLYMTVITLTTTGFSEVKPLGREGRIFTIILLTSGILVAAAALGSFTRFVIEGEILKFMGSRRLAKEIKNLKNHYIVCGYGRIGKVIAREFHDQKVPFVVTDSSLEKMEELAKERFPAVFGNSVEEETLLNAGIMRAKGLIAAVGSPADNVYITLSAKVLNPDIFVMGRANDDTTEKRLRAAGADEVVCPYAIGGRRMANFVLRPAVVEFVDLAVARKNLALAMEEIRIGETSQLVGKTIIDSAVRNRYGVIIVAILKPDGQMLFNPPPSTAIEQNDILIALGKIDDLRSLAQAET